METIKFLVQGSAEEPYQVIFRKEKDILSATCTCQAGENGQVCKHRTSILDGNSEGIASENRDQVTTVVAWLPGTNIAVAIKALVTAEGEQERAKKAVSAAKKNLAAAMRP
jgi:hypothetical protein